MKFNLKRFFDLMIFALVVIYLSFVQRAYAEMATPDVREYEFPNLLINEVNFKNTEQDFIKIIVSEYVENKKKSLKGMQISDDNVFFEIKNDILVESGDEIIISFKENSESITLNDGILNIKLTKSGLTGTTEQVILKNHNNVIVDGICWTSDSPTKDEIEDFETMYEEEQWNDSNISSCINSVDIGTNISIGRKNVVDTNSADDWEIILEENEIQPEINDESHTDVIGIEENNIIESVNLNPVIGNVCKENILISEIMPNPSGKDTDKEWIELMNTNSENCNLDGWQIDDQDGGSKSYLIKNKEIQGNGFLLLPSWETKLNLNNDEDEVRLFDSDNEIVVDVTYKNAAEGKSYAITDGNDYEWSLMPTPLLPNEFPELETANTQKETKATTEKNNANEKSNIVDGTLSDEMYITEIFPNPEGSDSGNEWIEIYNASDENIDMGNWTIDIGEESKKIFTFENTTINSGEYFILSDKDLGFALKNSENQVRLIDFEGSEIDAITYLKVSENESFMKISIEGEEEAIWKWNKNISPGKENQRLYKYKGKIEVFDEINSILNLQIEDLEPTFVEFHIIQSGDNILSNIFQKGIDLEIIASKEDDKLILETYEILEKTQDDQNDKAESPGINNPLYAVISFLPPLGFIGYFGVKKWGLIKFI
ncbi:lamin tail domain-containing protein [Patescibacteria group bacterium]|nr:lamin tail domain-containing protein [Patescibacteria group bacterium]